MILDTNVAVYLTIIRLEVWNLIVRERACTTAGICRLECFFSAVTLILNQFQTYDFYFDFRSHFEHAILNNFICDLSYHCI